MKIFKYAIEKTRTQLIKMPLRSEIMDIQMQNGELVMWALIDPAAEEIEVKINMYETGYVIHRNALNDEYLATVQDGSLVCHFFMCS